MRLTRDLTFEGARPPAVAGLFYPDEPSTLRRMVDDCLANAGLTNAARGDAISRESPPKAVIAPHAGYLYSGPVAGSAFEPLRPLSGKIERVVVIGPSHHVPFRGLALPAADRFDTPLGPVELDLEMATSLVELAQVEIDDRPHEREHALEVELPFLTAVLGAFRLVPLVVGDATPGEVAEVLERSWGGRETLVVVSSDLSHYLDYETARRTDRQTAAEIVGLRAPLSPHQACGARAINGLLEVLGRRAGIAHLLDLRSSGDTAGSRDQVVGYGAFAFETGAAA